MQGDTQKYSNETVYIVIAFLAILIIMPPLARILYAEEEVEEVATPVVDQALSNGKLVCTKDFTTTGFKITSTATYEDGNIVSNVIALNNPLFITSDASLDDTGKAEYTEFMALYSSFGTIPDTNKVLAQDSITVTIDKTLASTLGDNEAITAHMQDALTLQNSYEVNGYSCITE